MADQKEQKKSSGCGTLIMAAIIVFFVFQFISGLGPEDNNEPDTVTTTPPPTVVTEPVKPQPAEEEPAEPLATANISIEIAETIQEAPQSNELITRDYAWKYEEGEYTWSLIIPEAGYDYFKELPRPLTTNYSVYVTHPLDDPYIDALVEKLTAAAERDGLSKYQTVEMVTAFVQSLPYTLDSVSTPYDEYPRYPLETLADEGGDCEDTSILLAALLDKMGYGVVLLDFPSHVAVGLKGGEGVYGTYWNYGGDKYHYIETTGTGWGIGQLPEEHEGQTAQIYPMVPVPIITHEWGLEADGSYGVPKVEVNNLGTATASDVYVYAGFDIGNSKGWSLKESDVFNLGPGRQVTATLYLLPPPSGEHTRLMVWILMGGYKVDESYSVWFDT
ncbi:hypothetical protein ACFLSK_03395 [Chloroflexota bacterium]